MYPLPPIDRTRNSGYGSQGYPSPYLSTCYTPKTIKNATESPRIPFNGKLCIIKKSEKRFVNQTFCSTFAPKQRIIQRSYIVLLLAETQVYLGRESILADPKSNPNHAKKSSRTGRLRVLNREVEKSASRFLFIPPCYSLVG